MLEWTWGMGFRSCFLFFHDCHFIFEYLSATIHINESQWDSFNGSDWVWCLENILFILDNSTVTPISKLKGFFWSQSYFVQFTIT